MVLALLYSPFGVKETMMQYGNSYSQGSGGYSPLAAYQEVGVSSSVEGANPEQLIQLLFNRLIEHLEHSCGYIEEDKLSAKLTALSKALNIVDGLRLSLNHDDSPELSSHLESLYDYISRRLLEANLHNDISIIQEVLVLIKDVASAWDTLV